jgi:acetoin utilization deacetylase AcuC-like enzyme
VFDDDPRVLFVSMHQWPLYPGTGWYTENGVGAGDGTTVNVPLPPGTTGDSYLAAFDQIVAPIADEFSPTWVIISAGFDAHRSDPITDLALTAGDYPALTRRAMSLVPAGHRLVMLEGGYDLAALEHASAAVVAELADVSLRHDHESPTSGGPGRDMVCEVREHWRRRGAF